VELRSQKGLAKYIPTANRGNKTKNPSETPIAGFRSFRTRSRIVIVSMAKSASRKIAVEFKVKLPLKKPACIFERFN